MASDNSLRAPGGDTSVGLRSRTEPDSTASAPATAGWRRPRQRRRGRPPPRGRYQREVLRVSCRGGHIVPGGDGLLELAADAAGRAKIVSFIGRFPCRVS